ILLNNASKEVYQLDTQNKVAYRGVYSDLAAADMQLRELMPDHFAPTVEATGEMDTILGYPCSKFKVVRSGFIRSQNATYLWATDSIRLPAARYDIETSVNKVISPVPALIGYSDGVVLRLVYQVNEMEITYEATDLTSEGFDSAFFKLPDDYAIK
ncbi:MAG: DUF4412 domain-containing protein, partial [Chitinophagales bacterium]